MATQYTSILKLALPVQGELSGTWGDVVNDNITSMVEEAIAGRAVINTWTTNSHTLTTANGTTSESRCAMLEFTDTGTALTGAGEVICPTQPKIYIAKNDSGQIITVKTAAGTGIAVQDGETKFVFCDGTNVVEAVTSMTTLKVGTGVQVSTILDEDSMASDSATALATQQSIKAYVDSQVTAQDLDFAGDSGTGAVDLDSQSLTVAGTANEIETSASGQTLTVGLPSAIIVTTSVTTPTVQVTNINANDGTTAVTIADATGQTTINDAVLTTADINGGTADNVVIGGTTAAAGSFTTVGATGNITSQGQVITDTINEQTATSGVTVDGVLLKDGGATFTADAVFGDNDKAIFGAGSDLQIYHDGNHSIIEDAGTGAIKVKVGDFRVENASGNNLIKGVGDVATLHYGGSEKLATTSTGVDVTGTITSDGVVTDTTNGFKINTSTTVEASWTHVDVTGTSTINVGRNSSWGGELIIQTDLKNRANFASNGDISFYEDTGTTAKFFWDASAEALGIGTTTPVGKLDLGGSGDVVLGQAADLKWMNTARDTTYGVIEGLAAGTVFKFGSTEHMRIDSSGNVGIGTSSPSAKLQVAGNTQFGAVGTDGAVQFLRSSDGGAVASVAFQSGTSEVKLNNAISGPMTFYTNNTERMRIDSSGNVGIGTSSPNGVTEIVSSATGDVLALQLSNSAGAGSDSVSLRLRNSTSATSASGGSEITGLRDATLNGGSLLLKTASSVGTMTERMRIDSSGRVGIGTSSPSVPLEVNVSGTGDVFKLTRDAGAAGELNIDFVSANVNFNSEQGGYNFETSAATNVLVLSSSGNVGIGTSSPAQLLDVRGGLTANIRIGSSNTSQSNNTEIGTLEFFNSDTNQNAVAAYVRAIRGTSFGTGGLLAFGTSNTGSPASAATEAMRIDSSGNLLVGTTDTSLYNNTSGGGFHVSVNGFTEVAYESANAADPAFLVNNTGADGDIIQLRKDGAVVGSIGSRAGTVIYITSNGTNETGLDFGGTSINPMLSGSLSNGTTDLGNSGNRFKDLYLSGGVYLGGTVAANLLDDYEEGTWTPTLPNGGTLTVAAATYVKIGNQVTVTCQISSIDPSADGNQFRVGSLPFTNATIASNYFGGSLGYTGQNDLSDIMPITGSGLTYIYFHENDGTATAPSNNTMRTKGLTGDPQDAMVLTITYRTT